MQPTTEELLQQDWSGRCFHAAIKWIVADQDPEWTVVHGTIWSELRGRSIWHAWCERGDFVVDLARPPGAKILDRKQFYQVVKPQVSKRYSFHEALTISLKTGHSGPWEEWEQLDE